MKLLRFLQTGKFEKVGGEQTNSVNVRIISATNSDLKKEVKNKNFREDLYYRLNVIPLHLPALRERKNDIPLLVAYFLKQFGGDGGKPVSVSKEALSLMMDYAWPGNVRQLQNALQYAIVKSSGNIIQARDLPMEFSEMQARIVPRRGPSKKLDFASVQAALEKTGQQGKGRTPAWRGPGHPLPVFK